MRWSVAFAVGPMEASARRMLEIAYGEVIDAARIDLWASGLGQVDIGTAAGPQNPGHPVG